MDTKKIREALELAVVACSSPSAKEQYEAAYDACQSALSELDKAPKVLDAEEIKRIVETFAIEEVSQHGTQLVGMSDRQKEVCSLVLYHVSKVGYLAPAAGLTVESITLIGEQPEPAGEIKVMVRFSDGAEVEAIRTCANSIYHMVTWGGLIVEHTRLTAAIEAKR